MMAFNTVRPDWKIGISTFFLSQVQNTEKLNQKTNKQTEKPQQSTGKQTKIKMLICFDISSYKYN